MLKDLIRAIFSAHRYEEEPELDLATEMQKSIGDVPAKIVQLLFGGVLLYKSGLEPFFEKFKITSLNSLQNLLDDKQFLADLWSYTQTNFHLMILAAAIYWWYSQYRSAVYKEIGILRSLFPDDKVPTGWAMVENGAWLRRLPWLFYGTFFFLAFTMNNIQIFGFAMFVLFILDMHGNLSLRRHLARFLNDPAYAPDGPMKVVIQSRREAANNYWQHRPHIERIALLMLGSITAWQLSFGAFGLSAGVGAQIAGLLLAGLIATNEITMRYWRFMRSQDLAKSRRLHRRLIESQTGQSAEGEA